MEDAHIANPDAGVFAVFDGHGGKAVAKFAQAKFVKEFTQLPSYKAGNYELALKEVFHRIDELLEDPKYDAILKRYQAIPNPSEKKSAGHSDFGMDEDEDEEEDMDDSFQESEKEVLDENEDTNAAPMDISTKASGSGGAGGKKKLTTAQAVQFFHKLLVLEAAKRKGAPGSGTAPSSSMTPAGAASVLTPPTGVSQQQQQQAPVSIQTPHGPMCNLPDHRVPSGCTAVVAFKAGNQLFVANAGDSRGCLCRGGIAIPLSEDHKPLADRERKRVEAVGGFVSAEGRVNGNLNLSRSLGDLKYKQVKGASREAQMITAEPDVTVTTLQPGDRFFVLACDGVWDIMSCQEICDFVSQRLDRGMTTIDIVKQVFDHCIAQDIKTSGGLGGDNQTCLIVLLH